jgi:hypothetical protein
MHSKPVCPPLSSLNLIYLIYLISLIFAAYHTYEKRALFFSKAVFGSVIADVFLSTEFASSV